MMSCWKVLRPQLCSFREWSSGTPRKACESMNWRFGFVFKLIILMLGKSQKAPLSTRTSCLQLATLIWLAGMCTKSPVDNCCNGFESIFIVIILLSDWSAIDGTRIKWLSLRYNSSNNSKPTNALSLILIILFRDSTSLLRPVREANIPPVKWLILLPPTLSTCKSIVNKTFHLNSNLFSYNIVLKIAINLLLFLWKMNPWFDLWLSHCLVVWKGLE